MLLVNVMFIWYMVVRGLRTQQWVQRGCCCCADCTVYQFTYVLIWEMLKRQSKQSATVLPEQRLCISLVISEPPQIHKEGLNNGWENWALHTQTEVFLINNWHKIIKLYLFLSQLLKSLHQSEHTEDCWLSSDPKQRVVNIFLVKHILLKSLDLSSWCL